MSNDLYKFKFINPSKFSTKTGNNRSPGKYGDYELYLLGLIDEEEFINRKINIYNQLLDNKIISQEEYNERVNTSEVIRIYDKVIMYQKNDETYYSGIPIKYNINQIENLTRDIRPPPSKRKYQGLVVILSAVNNINNEILEKYTNVLNYFSIKENRKDPYNFYTATEGKATFSFSNLSENVNFQTEERENTPEINQTYKNGDIYLNCKNDLTKDFFRDNSNV